VPRRPLLLAVFLSLTIAPPLAACGNKPMDTSIPPLTPEPGLSLGAPSNDQAPSRSVRAPGFGARVALQRFLRGTAAGDPRACVYVASAFEKTLFGRPGCKAWMAQAGRHLTTAQRATLRAVRVPTATASADGSEFTIPFTSLRWSGVAPRPGGILRTEYVLRKTGGHWLLAA
jgi:hypothetical protein